MKRKKIVISISLIFVLIMIIIVFAFQFFQPQTKTIKVFTGFFNANTTPISKNNSMQNIIAEKIGAKCEETWIKADDDVESIIEDMILSENYPDFISAGIYHNMLVDAKAYIALDDYIDKYPNIKNYFTPQEWEKIRDDDGHIYIIPSFSKCNMYDTNTIHNDEAFWIQVKVLQWAGYPKVTTLDEYFDLIERYLEANPIGENGNPNIGYEIPTDPSIFFCLENPPQFLDGYPNDGSCMVDVETLTAMDYSTTNTAKRWFKKLNEEYKKGVVDPECFVMNKQQYYDKLSQGNVLGMVDQFWNFSDAVSKLPDECTYVPLGIVIDEGIEEHYHSQVAFDTSQGIGISVNCNDVESALQFINDLLSPEILNLRFWGLEGIDYSVDSEGMFYLTDEQYQRYNDTNVKINERCEYGYFPCYKGMNLDGINAYCPRYQPSEFYKQSSDIIKECFDAYGVKTFVELLNPAKGNQPWYPMWSYTNTFTDDTDYGKAKKDMDRVKQEYLPKVVMNSDFESAWNEFLEVYNRECDVEAYLNELTNEIRRSVQ